MEQSCSPAKIKSVDFIVLLGCLHFRASWLTLVTLKRVLLTDLLLHSLSVNSAFQNICMQQTTVLIYMGIGYV